MRVKEYLTFTKRERNGILFLVVIMLFIVFSPKYLCKSAPVDPQIVQRVNEVYADTTADTLRIKTDTRHFSPAGPSYKRAGPAPYKRQKIEPFEVNTADTAQFIALPGIGSKLASRIVTFREKLGGFYDVTQVSEVYGLQDSVFRKILPLLRCDAGKIRRININAAGKDELKSHPYIRWNIAEAVLAYREQHGNFSSADDLAKLETIEPGALKRMIPYISFK